MVEMQRQNYNTQFTPAYLQLLPEQIEERAAAARWRLEDCDLCARYCYVNRFETVAGAICRTGERAVVHSSGPHHGEEDCLRGRHGSGTIFFTHCNLRCVYCQNWDISWKGHGEEVSGRELAQIMLRLQEQGCHNINFVSPSHVVAQILDALTFALPLGLKLSLVYNTGGYDSMEALTLLDGIVDIYMPDMKYGDSRLARRYSKTRDYVGVNRNAVKEMHRQVGDLVTNSNGVAQRGLLVRHLVLPNGIAGTAKVAQFLVEEISRETYINIMGQYHPCYRADEYEDISRPTSSEEYNDAVARAQAAGLRRLDLR
jgi:putative pyruvate formate lyase activating enzyme